MLVSVPSPGLIRFLGEESSTFLPMEYKLLHQYPWSHRGRGWDLTVDVQVLTQTPLLFFFNLVFILYWSTLDLQCCISFRCTAK